MPIDLTCALFGQARSCHQPEVAEPEPEPEPEPAHVPPPAAPRQPPRKSLDSQNCEGKRLIFIDNNSKGKMFSDQFTQGQANWVKTGHHDQFLLDMIPAVQDQQSDWGWQHLSDPCSDPRTRPQGPHKLR